MNNKLEQFAGKKYLNIETFRKNGQGVRTPVWFTQDGEALRVWTFAGAGKIKRIRRDGSVRVTPSDAAGTPQGEWVAARASADESAEAVQSVENLMRKKYGLMFSLFQWQGKLRKSKTAVLKIELE
jgi:PPOX class probable F420-dependent enzyme